jgi:thymidylate synthase (FAD)
MTTLQDIAENPNYIPVLDHGFVGLVDVLGNDAAIVRAARVSYGDGTKSVREDRGLLRYLFRHGHHSPIEMGEVVLHIKTPIFVMRQIARHRSAAMNEYSGRYSVMTDEFYVPEPEAIQRQSESNRQGRDGSLSETSQHGVRWLVEAAYESSYDIYRTLLGERDPEQFFQGDVPYGAYDEDDPLLTEDFAGVARELARIVLPVGNYTELYWKQDLRNLFHFLQLRTDSHAQHEVRVYAEAIYSLIKPHFPLACEAYEDYMRDSVTLSRLDLCLLRELLDANQAAEQLSKMLLAAGGPKELAERYGMTKRELNELLARLGFDR